MNDFQKKNHPAYKPKTCPFCNFYGIRKNKDDWSCDKCGLTWIKANDPRVNEYKCHDCDGRTKVTMEYHKSQGHFYIIQCLACGCMVGLRHTLTTNEFTIDYDICKDANRR